MSENESKPAPTVRITPEFKKGEKVTHKGEGTTHTIDFIDEKAGTVRLSGLAAKCPITAIKKA